MPRDVLRDMPGLHTVLAMSEHGGKGDRPHPAALMAAAVLACAAMTLAVTSLPFMHFAYQAPALQVSLETSNALIALVVAYLVYGRFRESRRLQELLLVLALCTVAVANLVLTALPVALFLATDVDFSRWAALGVRLMGTLLLTGAALTPSRVRFRRRRAVVGVASLACLILVVGLAGLAFGGELPDPVDPSLVPADASRPILVGHPAVIA